MDLGTWTAGLFYVLMILLMPIALPIGLLLSPIWIIGGLIYMLLG